MNWIRLSLMSLSSWVKNGLNTVWPGVSPVVLVLTCCWSIKVGPHAQRSGLQARTDAVVQWARHVFLGSICSRCDCIFRRCVLSSEQTALHIQHSKWNGINKSLVYYNILVEQAAPQQQAQTSHSNWVHSLMHRTTHSVITFSAGSFHLTRVSFISWDTSKCGHFKGAAATAIWTQQISPLIIFWKTPCKCIQRMSTLLHAAIR